MHSPTPSRHSGSLTSSVDLTTSGTLNAWSLSLVQNLSPTNDKHHTLVSKLRTQVHRSLYLPFGYWAHLFNGHVTLTQRRQRSLQRCHSPTSATDLGHLILGIVDLISAMFLLSFMCPVLVSRPALPAVAAFRVASRLFFFVIVRADLGA